MEGPDGFKESVTGGYCPEPRGGQAQEKWGTSWVPLEKRLSRSLVVPELEEQVRKGEIILARLRAWIPELVAEQAPGLSSFVTDGVSIHSSGVCSVSQVHVRGPTTET